MSTIHRYANMPEQLSLLFFLKGRCLHLKEKNKTKNDWAVRHDEKRLTEPARDHLPGRLARMQPPRRTSGLAAVQIGVRFQRHDLRGRLPRAPYAPPRFNGHAPRHARLTISLPTGKRNARTRERQHIPPNRETPRGLRIMLFQK